MSYEINFGPWGSIFAVPTAVADRYLKFCTEEQLKVLLLALRQGSDALRSGTFRLLLPENPQLLAYERACGEERIRVCCNFSGAPAVLPSEIQGDCLLCDGVENGRMEPYGLCCVQLLHH